MYVYPEITEEGLVFTLDPEDREELTELLENKPYSYVEAEVFEYATSNGFSWVNPEDIGALTSAPILADHEGIDSSGETLENDRTYPPGAHFFWFPAYQVENPLETLRDTGRVVFTKG